ncbi:MAG TPA: NAD(P)H-binding protein [Opitutaceae bacterium]|nr:NAD(P)H-binding protein [Opitutaceae bacterium]
MDRRTVFVTGGTGYIGRRLIPLLLGRGHTVRALVRPGSEARLPPGCTAIPGNALDQATLAGAIAPADTVVQLVGVPHPSPSKAAQFRAVDLVSGLASVAAAGEVGVRHFVYVSVAHPSSMMQAYIAVRTEVEAALRASGLNATILRPWYILGPGHRWPYLLLPVYWLMEHLPAKRDTARRLGLVTLPEMLQALVKAVETPASGIRVWEVPEIRRQEGRG